MKIKDITNKTQLYCPKIHADEMDSCWFFGSFHEALFYCFCSFDNFLKNKIDFKDYNIEDLEVCEIIDKETGAIVNRIKFKRSDYKNIDISIDFIAHHILKHFNVDDHIKTLYSEKYEGFYIFTNIQKCTEFVLKSLEEKNKFINNIIISK